MKYTWTAGESLTWLDSRHLPRHFFNVEEDFSSAGGINLLITPYRHYSSPTLQLSTPGGESQSEWCRIGHQLCGIDYLQRPLPYLLIGYLVEDPKPERPLFILPSGVLTLPSGLEEEAAPSESQVVLQQHVEEPVKVTDAMVNAEELVEKLNKLGSHDVEFAKGACRIRKETVS